MLSLRLYLKALYFNGMYLTPQQIQIHFGRPGHVGKRAKWVGVHPFHLLKLQLRTKNQFRDMKQDLYDIKTFLSDETGVVRRV